MPDHPSSNPGCIKSGAGGASATRANDRQPHLKENGLSGCSSSDISSPPRNLFHNYPPNRKRRLDINARKHLYRLSSSHTTPSTSEDESDKQPTSMSSPHIHRGSPDARFAPFDNFETRGRFFSSHFPESHLLAPDFVEQYELQEELGAGGYSFVLAARDRSDGCEVAVKFIIKDKVPDHCWVHDETYGKLPLEVVILSYVNHENIVKCLDVFEDSKYFYLVQELHGSPWDRIDGVALDWNSSTTTSSLSSASLSTPSLSPSASETSLSLDSNGPWTPPHTYPPLPDSALDAAETSDEILSPTEKPPSKEMNAAPRRRPSYDLFECIEQSELKRLNEDQARYVFRQLVDVVDYLDSLGIAHRDIKDENVVIDQNLKIKLIDFGSATIVDTTKPRPMYDQFYGTAAYASSEILLKKKYHAAPAEVWTLGVLLSYLLAGVSPFPTVRDAVEGRIFLSESLGLLPSDSAMDLIRKCLDPNPQTRYTIGEIKKHPWLNEGSVRVHL